MVKERDVVRERTRLETRRGIIIIIIMIETRLEKETEIGGEDKMNVNSNHALYSISVFTSYGMAYGH